MSIEDKIAIQELNLRYAFYIDTSDVDRWVDTFTPDAIFDEHEFDFGTYVGRDQIRAYGHLIVANSVRVVHLMANHLVTDITATDARGTIYGLAEGVSRANERRRFHVLYEDRYAKAGGEWRISSRIVRKRFAAELLGLSEELA